MRRFLCIAALAALSACGPWVGSTTDRVEVSGESARVNYMPAGPGLYDVRAFRMRLAEGTAIEERQWTLDATGQAAQRLCPAGADLVFIERVGGPALYETRWKCR